MAEKMKTDIKRLVAFVTGASRGIGRGIALELAREGFDIAGLATTYNPKDTEKGLAEVETCVREMGRDFLPVVGDIADLSQHDRFISEVLKRWSRIDVLINNAGVAPLARLDILETTPESFDRLIAINLRGPFFFTQKVARQMIQQVQNGSPYVPKIIFITSISSHTASPNRAEYCISKAGLSMAAKNFAVRLAEYGIVVFDVRPGIIETDMTAAVKNKYDELIKTGLLLQRRWGVPQDVGKVCAALAKGYFDYATGSVFEISGGFSVHRL